MKRILALLLTLSLCTGVLAGCSKEPAATDNLEGAVAFTGEYVVDAEYIQSRMGGYDQLAAAGLPTQKGASDYTPAEVTISAIDETHVINTDALAADYDSFQVVDVRADEEYNGEVLYGEAAGGHLPGAIHIRFTDLFNEAGYLKSNEEITAMFTEAGLSTDDTIVTYCTAGIRSAYMQLILEMCGFEDSLNYDESYYRWCAVQPVE